MNCEKCKGDGRMIGGKLKDGSTAAGWGTCDRCQGTGQRSITVVEPPTIEDVIAAGYTPEEAAVIVRQEQDKAGRGERPYGPNDPTSPWGTPSREIIPDAPAPESSGTIAAALQKFTVGQKVALISGGPVMTVTADLGDEYACEWPIIDPESGKMAGKDARAFAGASLKPIVE